MSAIRDAARFFRNPLPPVYHGPSARLLHWLAVLAVAAAYFTGYFNQIFTESEFFAIGPHRQIGIFILILTAIRFLWRSQYRMPIAAQPLPRTIHALSNATQSLLYVCLILQPLVGWLRTNAKGPDVVLLGVIRLPRLVPQDLLLADTARVWHAMIGLTFAVLIGLHVAGALYHHFVRRDGLLLAMLPSRRFPRFAFDGDCDVTIAGNQTPLKCRLIDISAGGARFAAGTSAWVEGQHGVLGIGGLKFCPQFLVTAVDANGARVGFTHDPAGQTVFEKELADFVARDERIKGMVAAQNTRLPRPSK